MPQAEGLSTQAMESYDLFYTLQFAEAKVGSGGVPCSTVHSDVWQFVQNKARLDITRLQRLGSGLGNFTTSGIRSTQPAVAANAPALDDTSKEILRMVFDRNGSYLQVRVCTAWVTCTSLGAGHAEQLHAHDCAPNVACMPKADTVPR